jgi:maleylpyruvate isomerase
VTTDPLALADDVEAATTRFVATAATLTESAIAEPSRLPGWTRGHVLAHVARNADGLVNLLDWARTGVRTPQYPSPEARAADIEAGAARPAAEHLDDLRQSAERFAAAVAELPADRWSFAYGGRDGTAARVVWRRLREVEVHHVDLHVDSDGGYQPQDWPAPFAHRLLHELVANLAGGFSAGVSAGSTTVRLLADELGHPLELTGPPDAPLLTVSGPAYALAAWLSGRSAGAGLSVDPPGALPAVPDWM